MGTLCVRFLLSFGCGWTQIGDKKGANMAERMLNQTQLYRDPTRIKKGTQDPLPPPLVKPKREPEPKPEPGREITITIKGSRR